MKTHPNKDVLDTLNSMQEYIEGIQGFALVLKENLYNSGGMDEEHARAAAYVAAEIYDNLSGVLALADAMEKALIGGAAENGDL